MQKQSELIPITLLTGFLGSGKTTVLNHLIAQPELSDSLVIVNEFGETGLDHLLVAHSTESTVKQMNSGCMCCTIRSDLVKTLRDITWRFARQGKRQFERVVIETTGLADPAPIINTLMTDKQIVSKYKLDGIVTTVDMVNGADTLEKYDEAIKQVALADVLLLTKSDLIGDEQCIAIEQKIEAINAFAPRTQIDNGVLSPGKIINLELGTAAEIRFGFPEATVNENHHHSLQNRHHHARDDGINAYCFSGDVPVSAKVLEKWLAVLEGFMNDRVLRVKGILNVSGQDKPVVVHGVQHLLHPPTQLQSDTGNSRESHIVFITRNIGKAEIEDAFRDFPGVVPSARCG